MKFAIESGMIDLSRIQDAFEMDKRREFLNKHPYSVWEGKDGLWHTYFPGEKGRVHKKRKTKEMLEKCICDYWKKELENPTVEDVYNEWVTEKYNRGEISKATLDRYKRQYDESLSVFGKRKIKGICDYEVEDFLLSAIAEQKLTPKGYSNLRTLVYGIFKRAKKRKLVEFSITEVVSDMEISKKLFRREKKSDKELVFSEDETQKIIDYVSEVENRDIIDFGIALAFYTGLRPGELSALSREDVSDGRILVRRTEIYYKDENGNGVYEVRDFPKTEAGIRTVIIPNKAQWIMREIKIRNPFGKYVFEKNENRIRSFYFSRRLRSICKKLNIKERSVNKIRKTYATALIDGGVNESVIISQMGHTDIKTTKTYYYKDRKSEEQKQEEINKVFGL